MNVLLIVAVFLPALAGIALYCVPAIRGSRPLRARFACGTLAAELLLALLLCRAQGLELTLLRMTPTLAIFLRVDAVGCIFAVLMCVMWLLAAVFALDYLGHDAH